jgi:hypothetical protein
VSELEFALLTAAVFLIVVFALAVTFTVIWTTAPTGFLLVHAGNVPMLQEPGATFPQEFVGRIIEQLGG